MINIRKSQTNYLVPKRKKNQEGVGLDLTGILLLDIPVSIVFVCHNTSRE